MAYALRHGLFYRRIDGCPILLDISRDRYLALGTRLADALELAIASDFGCPENEASFRMLIQRGLVVVTDRPSLPPDSLAPVTYDLRRQVRTKAGVLDTLTAAAAIVRSEMRLRRLPFERVITHLRRRKPPEDTTGDFVDLLGFAASYRMVSGLVAMNDKCLARSLGLAEALFRRGHSATFVIGVAINPFAAHSWVQSGATVLNDDVDRVRLFSPIMAI